MASAKKFRLGLIGARGYVGSELIALVAKHPQLELAFVSSRERVSQLLADFETGAPEGLRYCNYTPQQALLNPVDVLVLALPNNLAATWVRAFDDAGSQTLLVDLSADYRFDNSWFYGLPELTRNLYQGQRRISNPGCYATAMQLAIKPMLPYIEGAVQCFGVSGYSGAGTLQSDKNNPEKLQDNLMPYSLVGHIHEREVSAQMACDVQFMPHVASHFRGISITVNMPLSQSFDIEQINRVYQEYYAGEPLLEICGSTPWLSVVAGTPMARLGGMSLAENGKRLVLVSVLDNLLKGAASQAMQNINLGLQFPETLGIL